MNILTEEQTKEIVSGAIEKIKEEVVKNATDHAIYASQSAIESSVSEIITKYIKEEVAPEILVSLSEQKSAIIKAAVVSAENLAVLLADSMTSALAEKLSRSYGRDKIITALFG